MMLRHFGEEKAADAIDRAIEDVLVTPEFLTPDVGGKASTEIVGKAIAGNVEK
jgi:tartrate dehydrogenase/decarboxylase/D-malate dehydrogenase